MDTNKLNAELIAIGEKIKAKGWKTASVDIFISYLAIFDRPLGPHDPMISYRPSLRATPHRRDGSFDGSGSGQEYVEDVWDVKGIEQAVAKLHEAADSMPRMADEAARIDGAKAKLSNEERRLLGIR